MNWFKVWRRNRRREQLARDVLLALLESGCKINGTDATSDSLGLVAYQIADSLLWHLEHLRYTPKVTTTVEI